MIAELAIGLINICVFAGLNCPICEIEFCAGLSVATTARTCENKVSASLDQLRRLYFFFLLFFCFG